MSSDRLILHEVQRLSAELMRERASGLRKPAEEARARLEAREFSLLRLQAELWAMRRALRGPAPAVAPTAILPVLPSPIRAMEAASDSAPATASIERIGIPRRRFGFATLAPYATIAACALIVDLSGARRPGALPADFSHLARPAAAAQEPALVRAPGAPVLLDDDRSEEALLLVQQWRLPGAAQSLLDRFGWALDLPGGRPAWTVERTAERGYRVSFRQDPSSPAYDFDADLESGVVFPSAETQELLTPQIASLHDSVR